MHGTCSGMLEIVYTVKGGRRAVTNQEAITYRALDLQLDHEAFLEEAQYS